MLSPVPDLMSLLDILTFSLVLIGCCFLFQLLLQCLWLCSERLHQLPGSHQWEETWVHIGEVTVMINKLSYYTCVCVTLYNTGFVCVCVSRSEEPGDVDASWALISGSGEETFWGEQEEDGGEAEGVRFWGAHEGAAGGGEEGGDTLPPGQEVMMLLSVVSSRLAIEMFPAFCFFLRRRRRRPTRRRSRRRGSVGRRMTLTLRRTMRWQLWWVFQASARPRRVTDALQLNITMRTTTHQDRKLV